MLTVQRAFSVAATASMLWQGAAVAADPPPGGGFGSVECGQAGQAQCNAIARRPGMPGRPTHGRSGGGGNSPEPAPTGCPPALPDPNTGCDQLGRGSGDGRGAGTTPPSPWVVAQRARERFALAGPVIRSSPRPEHLQLVGLPTWLWIDRGIWRSESVTASVPGVSVTVTAKPTSVMWSMGDGGTVKCNGPGTPYSTRAAPAASSPDCGYTYAASSAGQSRNAYPVKAAISWTVSWSSDGETGTLAPLTTTATASFQVAESQSLTTAREV